MSFKSWCKSLFGKKEEDETVQLFYQENEHPFKKGGPNPCEQLQHRIPYPSEDSPANTSNVEEEHRGECCGNHNRGCCGNRKSKS